MLTKYFFITGSSKGLGRALVNELLKDSHNKVFGLSRTNTIRHQNFTFIKIDLFDTKSLNKFSFPPIENVHQLVLINNAGTIGEIKHVGKKDSSEIFKTFQLNTIAPAILSNQFIKQYQNLKASKSILNISSGAGRHTISSWAEYCASKSALDMYSQVVDEEQAEQKHPFKLFSIAPGIIDTDMQTEIRSADKNDFAQLDYFKNLKHTNSLDKPEDIASLIISILDTSKKGQGVLLDVREL